MSTEQGEQKPIRRLGDIKPLSQKISPFTLKERNTLNCLL